jgi:hypothetical protein
MILVNGNKHIVVGGGGVLLFGASSGAGGTFVQSPTGTWGPGVAHAVATTSLANGANGRYQADYIGSDGNDVIIGMHVTAANTTDYGSWPVGIVAYSAASVYAVIVGGSLVPATISTVTPTAGDKFCLNRVGSVYTAEYFRGGVWTSIQTFTGTTNTTEMFLKCDMQTTSNHITNPMLV